MLRSYITASKIFSQPPYILKASKIISRPLLTSHSLFWHLTAYFGTLNGLYGVNSTLLHYSPTTYTRSRVLYNTLTASVGSLATLFSLSRPLLAFSQPLVKSHGVYGNLTTSNVILTASISILRSSMSTLKAPTSTLTTCTIARAFS
jgi:hypothetical protein